MKTKGDAMDLQNLQKEFNGSNRPKIDTVDVEVEIDEVSKERILSHFRAFERTWQKEGLTPSFNQQDFFHYCYTLFALRCETQVRSLGKYTKVAKRVKIPALMYLVLAQLGYVQIREIGLTLTPKFVPMKIETNEGEKSKIEVLPLMEPKDMETVSLHLQELENLGHEMGRGLPLDDGNKDFMLMEIVDNTMMTSDPATHPVYAFLKSFILASSLNEYIIPRCGWLERDEYTLAYESLIRSRNG